MTTTTLFRLGDHGPAVAEIRAHLVGLGLLAKGGFSGAADDAYDAALDRAVRAFQQQRGLTIDGVVGPRTYRALDEARWRFGDRVLSYVVSRPLSGDDVVELQQRLLDLGFDPGRADGILGAQTERALREFQRNVGLAADGTCGPLTYHAFARLERKPAAGGAPHALREAETIHRAGPTLAGKVVVVDPGRAPDVKPAPPLRSVTDVDAALLDVASRIEGRLTAMGVTAYLTRVAASSLEEEDRAAFANAAAADLLVSLTADAHADPAAHGIAAYFYGHDRYGAHSPEGERLAGLVQREIVARTGALDCRTHAKTWDLLRHTRMPAVAVDLGYVTSPEDARRLASAEQRDVVAEAVVVAVQRLYLAPEDDSPTGVMRLPLLGPDGADPGPP